ncbi:hypothetical protein [Actinomadura sp. 6N118]|uniref:hypothetical protein n=1 Tax=Actinomadura sp. 6N118 TaxID=3375151 RepID=UPI00378A27AF
MTPSFAGEDGPPLLDERRTNLTQTRVRVVNQLHALLRDLAARWSARAACQASEATALLRAVGAAGPDRSSRPATRK